MAKPAVQPLPLGTSSFRALRSNGQVYVDKTSLVLKMAERRGGKYFLSRPRRFGKSLLISTFESLFRNGLDDFQGLFIESAWNDGTYPVVRLDLSRVKDCGTAELFESAFHGYLKAAFQPAGFSPDDGNNIPFMIQFGLWLESLPANSLVLLIDEYDAPLTEVLNDEPLFLKIRAILSAFFAALKSCDGCLRFFFMTGITRLSNTSIFSAFNSLNDISLDPGYGTLLGYTEEEVRHCFSPWIACAAQSLQTSEEKVLAELRAYYDGFCFDEEASSNVYCPWSVLSFLDNPKRGFQNYWYGTGGRSTVLMQFLKGHSLIDPAQYGKERAVRLEILRSSNQYNEQGLEALLTQTGYLTIRRMTSSGLAVLGYPNQEVALSMARLYSDELLKSSSFEPLDGPSVPEILSSGSLPDVIALFNRAMNAIDSQRYPVRDEASARAYLQVLLLGASLKPRIEVHSALGRSDLEISVGPRHWVFELKFAKASDSPEKLLGEAIEQMRSRRYGEERPGSEMIRAALVFSEKERRFSLWKQA